MKINEIFGPTIQGEGPWMGKPATFVRFSGCVAPLCDFCDSKYSWKDGKEMSVQEVIDVVKKIKCPNVVITGGEPLAQDEFYDLIKEFTFNNPEFNLQIETSGKVETKMYLPSNVKVVISPKQYKNKFVVKQKTLNTAQYYKFVIGDKKTLNNALKFIRSNCLHVLPHKIYFMPLTTWNKKNDIEIKQFVWEACCKYCFNYTPRLHIDVWGRKQRV